MKMLGRTSQVAIKSTEMLNADEYDGPILLFNAHNLDKRFQYLNKKHRPLIMYVCRALLFAAIIYLAFSATLGTRRVVFCINI